MRGDEDALAAVRLADRHQLVALVKAQGADAVAAPGAAGFWRAPPPRRFVVAGVDGSDAYRT